MHYGLYMPNFGSYADVRALAALARDAEQAGWEGFFLWDDRLAWHLLGHARSRSQRAAALT